MIESELQRQPRSSFVTAVAFISIMVGVYMLITDLSGMVSYNSLTDSAEYRMAMQSLHTAMPDSSGTMMNSTWISISNWIGIILSASMIAASIGLFLRRTWGRVSYISLLWVQSVYYVATAIIGYFVAKSFIEQSGLDQMTAMSGMLTLGGSTAIVGGVITVGIAAVFTMKLSTPAVKQEFH